jgi:hypothetical protein
MKNFASSQPQLRAPKRQQKYLPLLLLTTFCFTLLSSPADARRGIKFGGGSRAVNGVKHYGADTLTVAQIRECLKVEARADAAAEQIKAAQPGLEERKNELTNMSAEIAELREFLESNKDTEFTNQEDVDAFNAKVHTFNDLIDNYNKKLDTYKVDQNTHNIIIDGYNEGVNQFQAECAGKRYYVDDMAEAKSSFYFAAEKPQEEAPQQNPPSTAQLQP